MFNVNRYFVVKSNQSIGTLVERVSRREKFKDVKNYGVIDGIEQLSIPDRVLSQEMSQ